MSPLHLLIFTYSLREFSSHLLVTLTCLQHDFTDFVSNICVLILLAAQDGGSERAYARLKNILSPETQYCSSFSKHLNDFKSLLDLYAVCFILLTPYFFPSSGVQKQQLTLLSALFILSVIACGLHDSQKNNFKVP